MNKFIFIFLACTVQILSQETRTFTFYGEFGYGFSRVNYTHAKGGYGLNLALTAGYDTWLVKYSRRVNNESSFIAPQEKINTNSVLVGHSFILYRCYDDNSKITDEMNITGYIGYSSIENQKKGKILRTNWSNIDYEHIVEHGNGIPIELEFQYVLPHFRAAGLSLFYNINEFRDFYGINIMIFVGYF